MVFQQKIARHLAILRVTDKQRHNMRIVRHQWQAHGRQHRFDLAGAILEAFALPTRCLQVADGDRGGRAYSGRKRRRKDEARRIGADGIDQGCAAGDVPAQAAERLGQRSLDDIVPLHGAIALADAATARTVHPDRVHLVTVRHSPIASGEFADRVDRRHVAVHRVKAFEHHELRERPRGLEQLL